jgi:AraC-like DNA-binding protein
MAITAYNPILYLWEKRTLFIGSLEEPLDISTGAALLMFALDKPIRFKTRDMSTAVECRSLLLPAGTSVMIDTQGTMTANCTLDPFGEDLSLLKGLTTNSISNAFYQLKNEREYIETLQAISSYPLDSFSLIQSLIQKLRQKHEVLTAHLVDSRIERVIKIIQNTISENLSLSDLESAANLSPSRLTELFKQQTGLPIRRYRLWYRLYVTVLKIGQGKTLTEAAAEAGFTDSSHFIRTFRSMLGTTPSCIFSQAQPLQVILPPHKIDDSSNYLTT